MYIVTYLLTYFLNTRATVSVMAALCNRGAIIFLPCDFYPSFFLMVALCNRADHYIFILFLISFFFLLFFPRLISAVEDWMSTILRHMVWS